MAEKLFIIFCVLCLSHFIVISRLTDSCMFCAHFQCLKHYFWDVQICTTTPTRLSWWQHHDYDYHHGIPIDSALFNLIILLLNFVTIIVFVLIVVEIVVAVVVLVVVGCWCCGWLWPIPPPSKPLKLNISVAFEYYCMKIWPRVDYIVILKPARYRASDPTGGCVISITVVDCGMCCCI